MNLREQELKTISDEFAVWQTRLSLLGSLNLYDANIFAEYTVQELLNIVFNYGLKNANSIHHNYPAVDLVDNKNRIAFQVTSNGKSKKVQQSIDRFINNKLYNDYDELYILVLGTKQNRYNSIALPSEISFAPGKNVLDLKDLLRQISFLPTNKISQIKKLICKETTVQIKRSRPKGSRIRKNLNTKKKFQKDFILEMTRENRDYVLYEPWIKFKYHNAILRDPEDKLYPEVNEDENNWLKAEFWDLYDQGVEFICHGGEAIFDKNGNWDIIDYRGDSRTLNQDYEVRDFWVYPRLAYDKIEDYDMEIDSYYSLPTIYCNFVNGNPYEEINFGGPGVFALKIWRQLFDNSKRKKTGW